MNTANIPQAPRPADEDQLAKPAFRAQMPPGADQATISRGTDDRGPENDGDGISSPRPLIMARQPAHRRQPPRRVTAARSASTRYPPISAACGSAGMIAGTAHTNQSAG
jgi:hypothetical protein